MFLLCKQHTQQHTKYFSNSEVREISFWQIVQIVFKLFQIVSWAKTTTNNFEIDCFSEKQLCKTSVKNIF